MIAYVYDWTRCSDATIRISCAYIVDAYLFGRRRRVHWTENKQNNNNKKWVKMHATLSTAVSGQSHGTPSTTQVLSWYIHEYIAFNFLVAHLFIDLDFFLSARCSYWGAHLFDSTCSRDDLYDTKALPVKLNAIRNDECFAHCATQFTLDREALHAS